MMMMIIIARLMNANATCLLSIGGQYKLARQFYCHSPAARSARSAAWCRAVSQGSMTLAGRASFAGLQVKSVCALAIKLSYKMASELARWSRGEKLIERRADEQMLRNTQMSARPNFDPVLLRAAPPL